MQFSYPPRLLIIDDNTALLAGLHLGLAPYFRIFSASDAFKGLTIAVQERPQIVLTDYRMEGMDGLELAGRLLERFPSLPIVLYTTVLTPELIQRCKANGIRDWLEKPFDLHDLAGKLLHVWKSSLRPE